MPQKPPVSPLGDWGSDSGLHIPGCLLHGCCLFTSSYLQARPAALAPTCQAFEHALGVLLYMAYLLNIYVSFSTVLVKRFLLEPRLVDSLLVLPFPPTNQSQFLSLAAWSPAQSPAQGLPRGRHLKKLLWFWGSVGRCSQCWLQSDHQGNRSVLPF